MEKKYKLTDESIIYKDKKLYRIEALKDFGNVRRGDKGGYVESEKNLSQEGDCWIGDDAKVFDSAKIDDDAKVYERATIYGQALIFEQANIYEYSSVFEHANVCGQSTIHGFARIFGHADISGQADICDYVEICDYAEIRDFAVIKDHAQIHGAANVYDCAKISGHAECGQNAEINGNAYIGYDAKIFSNNDFIVFMKWWNRANYFTWTRSNNMWSEYRFHGTGKELVEKAYKEESKRSCREYARVVAYVKSILEEENATRKQKQGIFMQIKTFFSRIAIFLRRCHK